MPAVDERVARVEGQVGEISLRLSAIEQRIDHLEERMNARFDRLEQEMTRQFKWLVGIHITSLLTVVATLGAIIAALLSRT